MSERCINCGGYRDPDIDPEGCVCQGDERSPWSYTAEEREADEEAAHSEEHYALAEYLDEQGYYHSEWCDIEPVDACPECVAERS